MSSFADFVKKLQQDPALQRELRAKVGDPAAGMPTAKLAEFAASKGYHFDVTDVSKELSDADLDKVAGGFNYGKFDSALKFEGAGPSSRVFLKISSDHKIV